MSIVQQRALYDRLDLLERQIRELGSRVSLLQAATPAPKQIVLKEIRGPRRPRKAENGKG